MIDAAALAAPFDTRFQTQIPTLIAVLSRLLGMNISADDFQSPNAFKAMIERWEDTPIDQSPVDSTKPWLIFSPNSDVAVGLILDMNICNGTLEQDSMPLTISAKEDQISLYVILTDEITKEETTIALFTQTSVTMAPSLMDVACFDVNCGKNLHVILTAAELIMPQAPTATKKQIAGCCAKLNAALTAQIKAGTELSPAAAAAWHNTTTSGSA